MDVKIPVMWISWYTSPAWAAAWLIHPQRVFKGKSWPHLLANGLHLIAASHISPKPRTHVQLLRVQVSMQGDSLWLQIPLGKKKKKEEKCNRRDTIGKIWSLQRAPGKICVTYLWVTLSVWTGISPFVAFPEESSSAEARMFEAYWTI